MLYRKVRVSHTDDKKQLYRLFYVPEGINLSQFAQIIMETFRMKHEHLYQFRKKRTIWTDAKAEFYEYTDDFGDYDMSEAGLSDPGDTYLFEYDFGDDWVFEVRIYKATKEFEGEKPAIVLEGKGSGIWEDNRWGYLALLSGEMPGNLSEDNEEEGWYLPWNLDLEKASDTLKEIDPEEETDYLESEISFDSWNEDSDDEDDDGTWKEFNKIYEKASEEFMNPRADGRIWIKAFEVFRKTCEKLTEEGNLPSKFIDIEDRYPSFYGDAFIDEMIDEMVRFELFDELEEILNQLEGMFEADGQTENDLVRGKVHVLKSRGMHAEAIAYLEEMNQKYPESYAVKAMLLNAYTANRKKKDGKKFLEAVLKDEPEITEENYPFYMAAADFTEFAGMKSLHKQLAEDIEKEDERQMDELDREFGIYDDDDDDYDYDDEVDFKPGRLLPVIARSAELYKVEQSIPAFKNLVNNLLVAAEVGELIWFAGDISRSSGTRINLSCVRTGSGEAFIPVYTHEETSVPEGIKVFRGPLYGLLKTTVEAKEFAGIMINPELKKSNKVIVETEILEHIVDICERMNGAYAVDYDDDPDGIEPPGEDWDDDWDEIPF